MRAAWGGGFGLLAAALGSPLAAQSGNSGIIQGSLRAAAGGGVAQAEIVALRHDGATRRQAVSGTDGAFRLAFLPPGIYDLSIRRIGFRPVTVRDVAVRAGRVESIAVTLEAAALALDSIVVYASAVTINTTDTEYGSRLTRRELALLPLPTDARDLVAFTPGARPDQVWGAATAQANNYQLDGVAVNHPGLGGDFLAPPPSWIEEFEVKGLGAGAEYGNFQGGLVNIVTRSGGNRTEGELRVTGETFHLNGTNLRISEAGAEPSHRAEVDGQVRGPLIRDRLHFALFAQAVDRGTRVLNRVRQVPGEFAPSGPAELEVKTLGKLTWTAGARDYFNASAGLASNATDRYGLDGFQSAEAARERSARTVFYNLGWQRTWSPRNFLEIKLAGFDGRDHRTSYRGSSVPGVLTLLEENPRAYQNSPFSEYRDPASLALSATWDVYARTFGAEHHLKIGGEQSWGSWRFRQSRNGGLTWRPGERLTPPVFDPADPATWVFNGVITSTWGGEVDLDSRVQNSALYAQDYIQVAPWLGINPGIRWGRWKGSLRPAGGQGYFDPVLDDGFDPRVGVVVDLSGHGSLVAKAHWGIFHQSMFAAFFDRAQGGNVYSNEERWEYTGPPFADPRTTFSAAARNADPRWRRAQTIRLNEVGRVENFKEPYVEQATLGLEKSWGSHLRTDALYVRRRNKNMVAVVDRNLANNYTIYHDVTVMDRFFRPLQFGGVPLVLPTLAVSNEDIIYWRSLLQAGIVQGDIFKPPLLSTQEWLGLTYRPDNVLTNVPEATRRFDQLQLAGSARFPAWWAAASLTVTRLVGNLNSLTGTDDYAASGAGPFVRFNEQTNSFGDLNNQSELEVKLQLGGNLPRGFRGGAFLTHFTGDRVTPTLTISDLLLEFQLPDTGAADRGGPPRIPSFFFSTINGQRIFVQKRGTYRYPARTSLDFHLERGFHIGRGELTLALDAFNALGASSITQIQTSVNGSLDQDFPSSYGDVRGRVPPRTLRLGGAMRF